MSNTPKTIGTLQEALVALCGLVKGNGKIEGAPKPHGESGPTPNALWREVKRDLSDLPRGERWIIRRMGEGRGNKPVKGVPNHIAIFLPIEESLVACSDGQLQMARALEAERWDLMNKYRDFLDFRETSLDSIQRLQKQTFSLIGDSIQHAISAGSNAALIAELSKAQAELMDELANVRADSNTAKGIMHVLNRIVSYVQLRKIKNWDELQKIPEMRKDVEEFFKWRDERDAPPPGDIANG